jgi:phage terminase large subunit-like protein
MRVAVLGLRCKKNARSRGQKVRGLRHLQHRPKLVVVDDPEDGEWVRTKENRDKTDRWLHSEVMPGMDARNGKLVVIGNLLHMDALLSRLKAPGTGFKVLEFPLIDKDGKCTWPAMYPTEQSLKDKERDMGTIPWQREMLLKIVSDDEAIIKPEDITYYDEMPKNAVASLKGHGIDLAISQKESADYTTIVSGEVFYVDGAPKIYIRPNPYNEHVIFHNFMQRVRSIPGELKGANIFFVEDVGYQKAAIQEMERMMLPVVPVRPTTDKRSRLQVVAPYIKNGTVLFPRTGCEQLLGQIFNLGVESHDDLCLAAGTKIATAFGDKPIEQIKAGDRVITPLGIRRVLAAAKTGEANTIVSHGLEGTPNHPVFAQGCGFTPLDALPMLATLNAYKPTTAFQWRYRKLLSSMASPTASWEGKDAITYLSQIQMLGDDARKDFTSRFGNFITSGQYRVALRFSIKTAILITTTLATWTAYRFGNIVALSRDGRTPARQQCSYTSKESAISQRNGTPHQRGVNGIVSTLKEFGRILGSSIAFASFAVSPSSRSTRQECSAGIYARTEIGRGDTLEPSQQETKPHGRKLKKPVYNLTIEDAHCYYANGILVGNCDGLTTLLNGLVEQGLELPKIHWIEA